MITGSPSLPARPGAIPPPPSDPEGVLAWAAEHQVAGRLDDVLIGPEGPAGTTLPGRPGERLTYRQILVEHPATQPPHRRHHDAEETARVYLHRIATLTERHRATLAWMERQGRDPQDPILVAFLARLRAAEQALCEARDIVPRPVGTYEPVRVQAERDPTPLLRYEEWSLTQPRAVRPSGEIGPALRGAGLSDPDVVLLLLGWQDGPLRWALYRGDRPVAGEVPGERQLSALRAMIGSLRDPDATSTHEALAELLRLPAWQVALGALDERLARLSGPPAPGRPEGSAFEERLAYRVVPLAGGAFTVEPLVQKRAAPRGVFSKGARIEWFHLPDRPELGAADRRAFAAYDDRFARRGEGWAAGPTTGERRAGAPALSPAQVFGILRALVDHPAVFLAGDRDETGRLDIRVGRLRLRFSRASDGALGPQFDLLGVPLLPTEAAWALKDGCHLLHLHRPQASAPQMLLAQLGPAAAALVHSLAVAPARFPPESHDALAARLESLQESLDIEFPSQWTRTIAAADGRTVVRLELLASGALEMELGVRPVRHGPVFAPGEGPALVLEGQGRDRHGVRRDRTAERQAAHALAERLGMFAWGAAELSSARTIAGGYGNPLRVPIWVDSPPEPWRWRVESGDPAFALVAALKDAGDELVVEWADEARLLAMGSVGRQHLRLKVGDARDWFLVEGGAEVAGEVVPLFTLLAAIREGWRFVPLGKHGFVRLEETLRRALAAAEASLFTDRGALGIAPVASHSLLDLVEDETQIAASAAFADLRRRVAESGDVEPRLSPTLAAALRPYQAAGVAWMVRLGHLGAGAMLADEMGLGKTIQTLAVLTHRAPLGPALVVAPTSVVSTWAAEAARFAPELKVTVYRGPERRSALSALGPGDVLLTSYAIASLDAEALAGVSFASLVLDEAQAVKNAGTERARALRGLAAGWRLGLSGTPIENNLGELWSLFRVISPGLFGSWERFRGTFAVPIEKFGDDRRQRDLAALLRPFVLRRTKAEVATELPARTEIVRRVRLSPEEYGLYHQLRASLVDEIRQAKKDPDRDAGDLRFELLAAITRLRQLCCHPRLVYPRSDAGSAKAGMLIDLLAELRDAGHAVLVFSQFRSFLELLEPRLRQSGLRVLVLDGTTPAELRARRVAAFQAGEADVFLISLRAGGVGLTLTAADTVVHLDPWWNPAVEDQATARAHRIGQTRPVTAIRLVAENTIEESVLSLHAAKRALAAGVLAGSEVAANLSTSELLALIQSPSSSDEDEPTPTDTLV